MLPQAEHLSGALRQHCVVRFWAPQHIPTNGSADETQILLELIACRNADRPTLSLELIDIAYKYGWKSPWLDDNRARAEFKLGRQQDACKIWGKLARGDDPAAAAAARHELQLFKNSCQLQHELLMYCKSVGWQPRHLGELDQPIGIKLEQALEEIKRSREEGAAEVSLKLIERCRDLGHQSPWLDDNQARLLTIKDREAAKNIWIQLKQHENIDVQINAKEALRHLRENESESTLWAAIATAHEHNQPTAWKELLLRRRLEADGADSSSWRRESIQLGVQQTRPWDLHTSQHQLFQQLVQEQLDQWNQQQSGGA